MKDIAFYTAIAPGLNTLFNEFDSMFCGMNKTSTFNKPPHNIWSIKNGEEYRIEVAVAGYAKENITVSSEHGYLLIEGTAKEEKSDDKIISHGISLAKFTKKFYINDMEIYNVVIKDGMLIINIKQNIPDAYKNKTYKIKGE